MANQTNTAPIAGQQYEIIEISNGVIQERTICVARKVKPDSDLYTFEMVFDKDDRLLHHIAKNVYPVHRWYVGPNQTQERISICLPIKKS
jgi:hypothetical protein